MVGAGATAHDPTVVGLAADAWVTFIVAVLLMSATASLTGLVPEAVQGAASCLGTLLCAMTHVARSPPKANVYLVSPHFL